MEVLLVDSDPGALETVSALTRNAFGDLLVRTASTLPEALEQAREAERLDLVLLDLGLRGCSGMEALLRFRTELPALRVLVISSENNVTAALEAGAAGFVPRSFAPAAVAAAVRLVAEGGTYIPPSRTDHKMLGLTEREYQVLRLLAQGLNNKDIARQLDIAEGTVKQHLQNLFRSLGVSSRVEALVTAARRGFRFE